MVTITVRNCSQSCRTTSCRDTRKASIWDMGFFLHWFLVSTSLALILETKSRIFSFLSELAIQIYYTIENMKGAQKSELRSRNSELGSRKSEVVLLLIQSCQMGNQVSSYRLVNRGCPQGSALGPLLWNIFQNDLPLYVATKPSMYADDHQIYHRGYISAKCKCGSGNQVVRA